MKRTILLVALTALALGGCARSFPSMTHRASTSKQPATHVATKASVPSTAKTPAAAPAKTANAHKS